MIFLGRFKVPTRIFFTFLMVILCLSLKGQVLPVERSVDWREAGLRDTQNIGFDFYNVSELGADNKGLKPIDNLVDSLLNLDHKYGVQIYFEPGTYLFNSTIQLPSNCWISGAGPQSTHFIFDLNGSGHSFNSNGQKLITDSSSIIRSCEKGDSFIIIANTQLFQNGDWIYLQQNDSDLIFSNWALNTVGQIIKVNSISGDTLYINSQLRLDYLLDRRPKVTKLQMKSNIALSCFSIERKDNTAPQQSSVINLRFAHNCWISGIESYKTTFGHVTFSAVSHSIIEKCYFHDAFEYGGGGRGYGVVLQTTTNDCLIENNIFKHLRHSMILQSGANGNVFVFNFSTEPFWTEVNPIFPSDAAGDIVLHGNYVFCNLFEQNDVQNIVIDNSHGSNGPYNTFLRNRASLFGIFFSDSTSPSQNFIGNEVPNTSFPYSLVNYTIQGGNHFTFANNIKGVTEPKGTDKLDDISYFYSSKPEFVPDFQWGKIGLPQDLKSASIPATDRFEKGVLYSGICGNENQLGNPEILKKQLKFYPNPAKYSINIKGAINVDYKIIDFLGRVQLKGIVPNDNSINIEKLKNGIYNIMINDISFTFIKH